MNMSIIQLMSREVYQGNQRWLAGFGVIETNVIREISLSPLKEHPLVDQKGIPIYTIRATSQIRQVMPT
jgi:hypothetical protein